jgi:hypothetical protein
MSTAFSFFTSRFKVTCRLQQGQCFFAVENPAGAMTKISTLKKIWNTSKLCDSYPNRMNRLAMDFVL